MKSKFHLGFITLMTLTIFVTGFSQTASELARAERERQNRENSLERDMNRRMQDMRALDSYARRRSEKDRKEAESLQTPTLDKKSKERVRQMRMINTADIEKYSVFLHEKNTGIFKLFPNFDCLSENLIKLDGECSQFVPESSDFSFRQGAYTHRLYHDIGYSRDELLSSAFFSQGLLVNLGDVPIENISLNSPGLKFLIDFKPASVPSDARQSALLLKNGIDSNGFRYSSSVYVKENMTYAVRTIAYRISNALPPISSDTTLIEKKFQSLNFDKRSDITVTFRIIRKEEFGGITIVWKELDQKDAAKIKFPKGETLADFR